MVGSPTQPPTHPLLLERMAPSLNLLPSLERPRPDPAPSPVQALPNGQASTSRRPPPPALSLLPLPSPRRAATLSRSSTELRPAPTSNCRLDSLLSVRCSPAPRIPPGAGLGLPMSPTRIDRASSAFSSLGRSYPHRTRAVPFSPTDPDMALQAQCFTDNPVFFFASSRAPPPGRRTAVDVASSRRTTLDMGKATLLSARFRQPALHLYPLFHFYFLPPTDPAPSSGPSRPGADPCCGGCATTAPVTSSSNKGMPPLRRPRPSRSCDTNRLHPPPVRWSFPRRGARAPPGTIPPTTPGSQCRARGVVAASSLTRYYYYSLLPETSPPVVSFVRVRPSPIVPPRDVLQFSSGRNPTTRAPDWTSTPTSPPSLELRSSPTESSSHTCPTI